MTKKQRGGGGGVSIIDKIFGVPEDPVEKFVYYAIIDKKEILTTLFELTPESEKKDLCLSAFKLLVEYDRKGGIQNLLTICKSSIDDTMMSQFLNFAIDKESINIVNLLLTNGAQIELTTAISGFTSLYRAVRSDSIKIVDILLKNGAKPSIDIIDTSQFYSCLHLAVLNKSNTIIKLLIDNGANINIKDSKSQTPLHHAVSQGSLEIVKLLIKSGADISSKTINGQTPLHFAVSQGSLEIVKLLIESGANISLTNNYGQTPLHIAAKKKDSLAMIKLLIKSGAEISPEDNYGHTPEDYAKLNQDQELIDYFESFKGLPVIAETNEVSIVPIESQVATRIDPTPGGKVTKKSKKINRQTKTKSRLLNKKRRSYKKK